MATAIEVAKRLIHLAASEEEPDFLTPMQLQKLLYYAQGWSLALRGKPLFGEPVLAWKHGPVVREVFNLFKYWKDLPIRAAEVPVSIGLDPDEERHVEYVWSFYSGYSASALRKMTHDERPWVDARGDVPEGDPSDEEITQESMRAFFVEQKDSEISPVHAAEIRHAIHEHAEGKGYPLEQMLAEFGI